MKQLEGEKVTCPLSGGINSAAVLCWLIESGIKPSELHLFYADFDEHSPDTLQFTIELMELAKSKFDNVFTVVTSNSVIGFFEGQKMIPHPMASPCSRILKIEPMMRYNAEHGITLDLVGYVKHEKSRMANSEKRNDMYLTKLFPISQFTDDWCFEIVKKHLGWYPSIYDIKDEKGKRVFKHNNCLPCKNMTINQLKAVQTYYPDYMANANELSAKLQAYWGRSADDYYTTFGKQDYEAPQCETCSFD